MFVGGMLAITTLYSLARSTLESSAPFSKCEPHMNFVSFSHSAKQSLLSACGLGPFSMDFSGSCKGW